MFTTLWNTVIYDPFYNGLILLSNIVPAHDVGIAIIILTILVKTALYPLSRKAVLAQREMRSVEGELSSLKEKHKDDRKKLAEETMALYKRKGINPVSGCLPALIQIPFIIGLYVVFLKGIAIDPEHLYSFVSHPESLNTLFLGLVDLSGKKSILFAILAGASQYVYAVSSAKNVPPPSGAPKTPQEEFARAMQVQMKYVFPAMIAVVAYQFSIAVALYWVVGNIVSIAQDVWVRRSLSQTAEKPA
jgi:YidC/Oxa1 family membrane protein insertase